MGFLLALSSPKTMPNLFEPLALRSVMLPNRIVLSPMCQYSAVEGLATDWHSVHLGRYAAAGLGLLIIESTHVSAVGRISPRCLGLYTDEHEAALKRIVTFLKTTGAAPTAIQLAHAGRKASRSPPWLGSKLVQPPDGWTPVGPSAVAFDAAWQTPTALNEEGISNIVEEFVIAAQRADRAGFDVCELHSAHGYLMHEFLSPVSNRRADSYGGSRENRMRFPIRVVEAVRAVWPKERPLLVRISGTDFLGEEGGASTTPSSSSMN